MNNGDSEHMVMSIRCASVQTAVMSGVGGAVRMSMHSIVKKNTPDVSYCIPNEWICGELARFLRLPVPPFCTVKFDKPEGWGFVSLDASLTGETFPPANFERCANRLPSFATGMLLFDVFVMNPDRHEENFSVDYRVYPNPKPLIFDHGHALFGHIKGEGEKRLEEQREELGLDGDLHRIMPYLETDGYMDFWMERFMAIPEFFIREICLEACEFGLSDAEANTASSVLIYRKSRLLDFIRPYRQKMTMLQPSLFSSFADPSNGAKGGTNP